MNKDISLANQVLDKKLEYNLDDLWKLLSKMEKSHKLPINLFSNIHRIIDSLEQISDHSVEIAEIAIDRVEEI